MASSGSATYPHRRKRQRLSSPIFDDQPLSQEEFVALNEYDGNLPHTQSRPNSPSKISQVLDPTAKLRRDRAIAAALGLSDSGTGNEREEENCKHSRSPSPIEAPARNVKENHKPPTPAADNRTEGRHTPRSPTSPRSKKSPTSPGKSPPRSSQRKSRVSGFGSALALARAQPGDEEPLPPHERPFSGEDSWFESTTIPDGAVFTTFTTAKSVKTKADEDAFFNPPAHSEPIAPTGFQSAKSFSAITAKNYDRDGEPGSQDLGAPQSSPLGGGSGAPMSFKPAPAVEVPQFVGFRTASSGNSFAPSAKALQEAEARMRTWEKEIDEELQDSEPHPHDDAPQSTRPTGGSSSVVLESAESLLPQGRVFTPDTLTPSGFSSPRQPAASTYALASSVQPNKKLFKSPLLPAAAAPKPFRPPAPAHTPSYVGSPLNPRRTAPTPAELPRIPAAAAAFTTPSRPTALSSSVHPPADSPVVKSLGATPRRPVLGATKPRFVTPFKPGMKPGEPGRLQLDQKTPIKGKESMVVTTPTPKMLSKGKGKELYRMDPRSSGKITLAASGLFPQQHSYKELEAMGVSIFEMRQITLQTALDYSFLSASPEIPDFSPSQMPLTHLTFGTSAAYEELRSRGYELVTKDWVENHWALVLWKLAGMACLEPQREGNPKTKRWCWGEVIRQLELRYNRDLNSASRPPIRLITTQDSPPTCPMVLCVSGIFWPEGDLDGDEDDTIVPVLEVTDGWYKIRAEVDPCLTRAIRKGHIRVGRKLATVGARLSTESKEPAEPLEAYSTVSLKLSGNSTHLALWHAKLGFHKHPFIATLRSLSPDGGVVAVMDLVVVKAYPIAFMEFIDQDGKKTREGPLNEKDENAAQDRWRRRREAAANKLRFQLEHQVRKFTDCADRLEVRAGSAFRPSDDGTPPPTIDDYLLDLEDIITSQPPRSGTKVDINVTLGDFLKKVTPLEAGWLARAIREKVTKDRENHSENVQQELDHLCPPRQVRSLRVLVTQDANPSSKHPSHISPRKAQLTVWDALQLRHILEQDESGSLGARGKDAVREGQRFMVTNLVPTQVGSWRGPDETNHFVFLSTRKDSRWTKIKAESYESV